MQTTWISINTANTLIHTASNMANNTATIRPTWLLIHMVATMKNQLAILLAADFKALTKVSNGIWHFLLVQSALSARD